MNLYILIVLLFSSNGPIFAQDKTPITFNEFLNGQLSPRIFNCRWISETKCVYQDSESNIVAVDAESNGTTLLIDGKSLLGFSVTDYSLSSDEQKVLIQHDRQEIFRHSVLSKYTAFENETEIYYPLANGDLLSIAVWTPTGDGIVYVKDNNLYYVPSLDKLNTPVQLTTSGVPGIIFNGVPDWVYEEEVIGSGISFHISPKSSFIIYTEINDTDVPEMEYTEYGSPGKVSDQYPKQIKIRYPKAGQQNPSYKTFLRDLRNLTAEPILLRSDPQGETIFYLYDWINNNEYMETTLNRVQNESLTTRCATQTCQTIHEEANSWGWARDPHITFNSAGNLFAAIEPVPVSDLGNFSHLVLRNGDGMSPRALTSGQMVVKKIHGWFGNDFIFYEGTEVGRPTHQQLYAVNIQNNVSTCITCNLKSIEQNSCTSSDSNFAPGLGYFIVTCLGPDPFFTHLYATAIPLNEPIRVLEENLNLRETLKTKLLPKQLNVKVNIGSFQSDVRLFLPPNLDLSNSKKYPLLIEVYAGPDTTNTMDEFAVGWESYLTGNLGIIYGFIDGRSSSNRGDDVLFGAYKGLGFIEILDQINATKELQKQLSWIDETRTAIWGWSYGGYATGRALELDKDGVFKCGISVAPVTSWIYYDSIYTERYMGLPYESDNLENYMAGDLVTDVSNLKNKRYLLVHGNADDNVHYQNSMMLSKSLEQADILFQQQSYPDENHSLGHVRRHLYHTMQTFWENCFDLTN